MTQLAQPTARSVQASVAPLGARREHTQTLHCGIPMVNRGFSNVGGYRRLNRRARTDVSVPPR